MSDLYRVNLNRPEDPVFEGESSDQFIPVGYPEARLIIGRTVEDMALYTGGLATCHTVSMTATHRSAESAALFLGHTFSQPPAARGLLTAVGRTAEMLSSRGFNIEHVGLLVPTRMSYQLQGEREAVKIAKIESKQLAKDYDARYARQSYSRVRSASTWFSTIGFDSTTKSFVSENGRQ